MSKIAKTNTVKLVGVKGIKITCECTVMDNGIGISLVGIADSAVKENLLRIVTAMQSQGYHVPGKKVVINLAPSDLHKSGSLYDLPILMAMIAASEEETLPELDKWIITGEIGLDASVRGVNGCIQAIQLALDTDKDFKGVIIPHDNVKEVAAVFGNSIPIYGVNHLKEAVGLIKGALELKTAWDEYLDTPLRSDETPDVTWDYLPAGERRALEIAAAGGHHMLLMGNPGSGKASIAKQLVTLLPRMSVQEVEEVAGIYSAARGACPGRIWKDVEKRPFRAPHVSASLSTMLGGGGGDSIQPGEVSLAHKGVLFIDEFPEAPKALVECLRTPMEDHKVTISRLKTRVDIPADCLMVFASNPCPCGYYGMSDRCTCTPGQRAAYLARLSSPVMDHVAMQVWCHPIDVPGDNIKAEPKDDVRERIDIARRAQKRRFTGETFCLNDRIPASLIDKYCPLDENGKELLERLIERLGLSARAYSRILKLARTIADLDGSDDIKPHHLSEAASYRFLDRVNVSENNKTE